MTQWQCGSWKVNESVTTANFPPGTSVCPVAIQAKCIFNPSFHCWTSSSESVTKLVSNQVLTLGPWLTAHAKPSVVLRRPRARTTGGGMLLRDDPLDYIPINGTRGAGFTRTLGWPTFSRMEFNVGRVLTTARGRRLESTFWKVGRRSRKEIRWDLEGWFPFRFRVNGGWLFRDFSTELSAWWLKQNIGCSSERVNRAMILIKASSVSLSPIARVSFHST